MRLPRLATALLLLACAAPAFAGSPGEAMDAFHKALRDKAADKALALMAEDAVVYEQGFSEVTRKEWARKQLGAAVMLASDTERRILSRESREAGDVAWVLTTTRTIVDVDGRNRLLLDGAETAVLRREQGAWKIQHLHWSAHEAPNERSAKP